MLRSIKHLYGDKLGASDGEIGHVKDFYFDDRNWAVRYLVVDTGSWLTGRLVLISPHSFGTLERSGRLLMVNLTRKQIEESPPISAHNPVSRQYEEAYYRYYGLPFYWQGGGLDALGNLPLVGLKPDSSPNETAIAGSHSQDDADKHLRSTKAVDGYHIQALDGEIGRICDFMVDDQGWTIHQVVIEAGHWYAGKQVFLLPENIDWISYEDSTVFVNLTREDIRKAASHEVVHGGTTAG